MSLDNYRAEDAAEDAAARIDAMAAELVALRMLLAEVQARLVRDEQSFRAPETVARLGADAAQACAATCRARAKLVQMAAAHVAEGRHERAVALLRGDMPRGHSVTDPTPGAR